MNHSITSQYAVAAKSANKSLGLINRKFVFKDKNTVLKLFKSLLRLKLEYCVVSRSILVLTVQFECGLLHFAWDFFHCCHIYNVCSFFDHNT